jgi:ubiquinone/menaquinone biosynthesis C-methylase UbiE
VDYDKTNMAATYDQARAIPPERMKPWTDRFIALVPRASAIVDLGCGTGRFSQTLADLYGAHLTGVDPSETMLAQARAKAPHLTFLVGAGEALPLPDESADLVFISLAYHHFADPVRTARECRRVLRPGGGVMIRTPAMDGGPYRAFARFFPGYNSLAAQTMPTRAALRATFAGAGFTEQAHEVLRHPLAADWTEFAAKLALRADSFLARLGDDEYERGLSALETFAAQGGGPVDDLVQAVDLFVFRCA